MGSTINCYFMELADQGETSLRRYVPSSADNSCSLAFGYHNAEVSIGRHPWDPPDDCKDSLGYPGDQPPKDDPRWPKACPCGYVFRPADQWQQNIRRLYRRVDTGEVLPLRKAPVGAMWYADWYHGMRGPDGHTLVLKTPAGDWIVDGPSEKGKGWQRTGTPPKVTATPSIGMGKAGGKGWTYHGWLRDGKLVEV